MRLIHISDFHIDANNLEDLRNYVIKPLIKDLIKANEEKTIDMIAFSGDLVDKAGLSFEKDIELAFYTFQEEVIEPIMNVIKLPCHRFFFVPGNHDIVRDADKEIHELGLMNYLKNSEMVSTFIDSGDEDGIRRILPFKKFEKEYFQNFNSPHSLSNFQSAFTYEWEDTKVGVTCFNSSWRCYDSKKDYQNIVLGERQITRAREIIEDCDIKVGILHHPLDEFAIFESKQIEAMLIKDYDILLFGHVHEGSNWSKTNISGSTIISIAPSNWTTNVRSKDLAFANGYSIIDFSQGSHAEIRHRRYSHHKESFVANTDLGDDYGKTIYLLPSVDEMAQRESEYTIIQKIKDVHLNSIDQHLISYETDTIAPKKIEDMFVLPRIVQKEEIVIEEEVYSTTEKTFTIEEICKSRENLLLVGVKEAGKTILMDKILLELTNNYNDYTKIPIYINFTDTASNKIETIISKYLNIGILDIKKEILKNYNIVLLIDNIKFENKQKTLLSNLEKFLKDNPNVSAIASCTSSTEGEIPIEALSFNILELFKPAFIKSFRSKEIRELMEKWFGNNSNFLNRSEELEKLIKTFGTLNIPRTPLAVSMFLWIIEKQENYAPVNNAQMLENFLERIFTKTSANEVYSSEFNYKNKERLLTEIALFMYNEKEVNYRVNYQSLRTFIFENLKIKMFDFDEEALLKHFIQKGVFSVEKEGLERYVRFKFNCFFQFFLMKNIDINKEFKSHVLSEEYYLHFVDELDYYSGLKIDDVELLELTVNRMHDEYYIFLSKVEDMQYSYDNPFETLSTIVDRLSHSDIEIITSQDNKQTEEDIEREQDKQLSSNHENKIIKKDDDLNPIVRLERLWVLAAKVLKNTEEVKIKNLKSDAFTKVIKCSMAFATIYKHILTNYQKKQGEQKGGNEKDEQMEIMGKLLPLIHQVVVYQTLGTGKLNIVLQEKIENLLEDDSISDFEKFLYVFIYADLKGKNRVKYIGSLIKNIKRYYIKDMIFMKLLEYYYKKETTKIEEGTYKNLLGNLLTKDDGESTLSRDFHRKGRFIASLEKSKKEKLLLETGN